MNRYKVMRAAFFDERLSVDVSAAMAECLIEKLRDIRAANPRITTSVLRRELRRALHNAILTYFSLPYVPRPMVGVPEPGSN